METELRMMVRGKELHCRQGWGDDRWDVALDDVVLDIWVREPDPEPGSRRLTMTSSTSLPHRAAARTAESIICAWAADEPASEANAER